MAELDDVVNAINSLKNSFEAERTGTAAKTADELELENKMLEQRQKHLKEELAAETDLAKKAELRSELYSIAADQVRKSNKDNEKKAKILAKIEKQQKKNAKTTEKATKAEQEHAEAINSVVENLSGFLGVSRSYEKSLLGQIAVIRKSKDAQKKFGEELSKTFSKGNIAMSAGAKAAELFTAAAVYMFGEVQAGVIAFNEATGMAAKYEDQLMTAAAGLQKFGVTNALVGKSLAALAAEFPLRELEANNIELARNFALYERFGVSAASSAKVFATLTRSLGMTAAQATATQEQIFALGNELGMGAANLARDFQEALPRIGIYGNQAVNVFRKVASASSQLGLSTSDILDLAEGFQTFEGSAQAAGKLNAILGGGFIDNLALMEASFEDPAKAALMIQDAFNAAGQTVSSMGPAALKASAAAAGFSDVNKFRSFLEGKIDAKELMEDETQNLAFETKQIAARSSDIMAKILGQLKDLAFGIMFAFNKFFGVNFTKMVKGLNKFLSKEGYNDVAATAALAVPAVIGTKAGLGMAGTQLATGTGLASAGAVGLAGATTVAGPLAALGVGGLATKMALSDDEKESEAGKFSLAMMGGGAALGALGAIATSTGILSPLGIGMMAAGAGLLGGGTIMAQDTSMPENKAAQQATDHAKKTRELLEDIKAATEERSSPTVNVHNELGPGLEPIVKTTVVNMAKPGNP